MKRLMILVTLLAIVAFAARPVLAKGGHAHHSSGPHHAAAKPAHQKPAAHKPADHKPAAQKPAAQKPAAHKPADHKPAQESSGPGPKNRAQGAKQPNASRSKTMKGDAASVRHTSKAKAAPTTRKTKSAKAGSSVARSVVVRRPPYGYARRSHYRHALHRRGYRRGYAYGRPSFMQGADQVVAANSGPQIVSPWATHISAGGRRMGGALQFVVLRDSDPGLFRVPPAISPTGVLTFSPAPGQSGQATIRVVLRSGGRSSLPHTFRITVRPG